MPGLPGEGWNWQTERAEILKRAEELDLRRQAQIANQVKTINGLLGRLHQVRELAQDPFWRAELAGSPDFLKALDGLVNQ